MLIIPLRIPLPMDLRGSISAWLDGVVRDQGQVGPDFSSGEIQKELMQMDALRTQLVQGIMNKANKQTSNGYDTTETTETAANEEDKGDDIRYAKAKELIPVMEEYYAMLAECEARGFPSTSGIKVHWMGANRCCGGGSNDDHSRRKKQSQTNGGNHVESSSSSEILSGLLMERASILWNLAAIQTWSAASLQSSTDKKKHAMANKLLQQAYTYILHLKEILQRETQSGNSGVIAASPPPGTTRRSTSNSFDFSAHIIAFWAEALQAEAQMAGYGKAASTSRPKHLLLAKLAQAAVPLWDSATQTCQEMMRTSNTNIITSTTTSTGSSASFSPMTSLAQTWETYSMIYSQFMSCKAEYHESMVHREKEQFGSEMARLQRALAFGKGCQDMLLSSEQQQKLLLPLLLLQQEVPSFVQSLVERFEDLSRLLMENNQVVPHDLREIRGELLSKGPGALPKSMLELKTPMFMNIMGPAARSAMDRFYRDMDRFVASLSSIVEEKTEGARKALQSVNLPHSLTAYKQEQSGGGIPMDLWERVDTIQREGKVALLKQELWGLRDVADLARSIYTKTHLQLEEDLEMDQLFRQQNPSFQGHDVTEVQESFRQALGNYKKLLTKSQEGDAVLLRRLEALDQDPKYKLLQFGKSQLDRLLPGNGNSHQGVKSIDTTHLSRMLVELSNLFRDREQTLGILKQEIKKYDIGEKLRAVDPISTTADQEYALTVKKAQKSFAGLAYEIQLNIDKQIELLETILYENEQFLQAREAGASSVASESCIAMIEDAMEEIDQLTKHLREGRDFYDVVIPKLEQLKQQVGDASVRLTVERCEFEENAHHSFDRRRQEADDARMAATLADANAGGSGGDTNSNNNASFASLEHPLSGQQAGAEYQGTRGDNQRTASHPGVVTVSHGEPQVRVDDEKVASLVAMEFDPDKVVEALRKFDNNVEEALNELLSG